MTDTEAMEKVRDAVADVMSNTASIPVALENYLRNAPGNRETLQTAFHSIQLIAVLADDLANELARVLVAVQK